MSARTKKPKQSQPVPEKLATPKKVERSHTTSTNMSSPVQSSEAEYRSPSPLNISRVDEKEELAHLNDRLASYIDYVRKLERDKESLTRRISTITEERLAKVDDARKTYENEIQSLRRLVDDLAKEKAARDVELKKHMDDASDAKSKLNKRDAELRNLQRKYDTLERDIGTYKADHERYQKLLPEFEDLEKNLEAAKEGLKAETILRTDLENKVASLREELDFKDRLFQEERSKLVMHTLTVEEEVAETKAMEFESRLADELQAYRDSANEELEQYRLQMESTFQSKLEQLQKANEEANRDGGRLNEELTIMRRMNDDLSHELARKSREVELLHGRIADLEKLLDKTHDDYQVQLAAEREEIKRLRSELEQRFAEFTDLMNTKVVLDQEILMYRKMLEGEESRAQDFDKSHFGLLKPVDLKEKRVGDAVIKWFIGLNLTSPKRHSAFSGGFMSAKKRRLDSGDGFDEESGSSGSQTAIRVSTSAVGSIEFSADQDGSGKWVKLGNVGKEDINIGNWVLKHKSDGEEVTYKFARNVTLKPGTLCTVWSSDTGATHNPPEDIVMKNQGFHTGANITVTLTNENEEEQASCLIVRESRPKLISRRFRAGATRSEELNKLLRLTTDEDKAQRLY
ncbi:hypothetical protein ACTXT7_004228 [Hymenolepis weldensis]